MNVDSDIAPLLEKMNASMGSIRTTLLPMLAALEEDTLVTHYSLEEQARLSLSAAFAIAFSLYSLDKLQNKQHAHLTNVVGQSVPPTTDVQLVLKIERITEYIKKLREITLLHQQQQKQVQQNVHATTSTTSGDTAVQPGIKRAAHSAEVESEQPASKAHKSESSSHAADAADAGNTLGDAEMFSVVSRVPGETGTVVSRLLHQAKAANNVSHNSV